MASPTCYGVSHERWSRLVAPRVAGRARSARRGGLVVYLSIQRSCFPFVDAGNRERWTADPTPTSPARRPLSRHMALTRGSRIIVHRDLPNLAHGEHPRVRCADRRSRDEVDQPTGAKCGRVSSGVTSSYITSTLSPTRIPRWRSVADSSRDRVPGPGESNRRCKEDRQRNSANRASRRR